MLVHRRKRHRRRRRNVFPRVQAPGGRVRAMERHGPALVRRRLVREGRRTPHLPCRGGVDDSSGARHRLPGLRQRGNLYITSI